MAPSTALRCALVLGIESMMWGGGMGGGERRMGGGEMGEKRMGEKKKKLVPSDLPAGRGINAGMGTSAVVLGRQPPKVQ